VHQALSAIFVAPNPQYPIGGYAIGQRFAVREHSPVVLTILFLKDGCSVSGFSFLPVLSLFLNSMQTLGASVWLRAKLIFCGCKWQTHLHWSGKRLSSTAR